MEIIFTSSQNIDLKNMDLETKKSQKTRLYFLSSLKTLKNMNLIFCKLKKLKRHEFNCFFSNLNKLITFFASYKIQEKMNLISGKLEKAKNIL